MKLKYSFETVDMGEEIISVPVGEGVEKIHGILKHNKEGQEILEQLEEDTTEEQIVDVLASKYENDRETLAAYVHRTVETLRNAGLIEE
ncbi:MAG: PqqD family protein [Clostridia bacterium]|nr:PqqD family protein [Clostridia bacterium]